MHTMRCGMLLSGGMLLLLALAACHPEPAPSASGVASTPAATPTVSETTVSDDELEFPDACEKLYSPAMFATLEAEIPPLDDPGTTMLSTENADALAVIAGAAQTLRCSWGPPSERGISTNVTVVSPEQRDALFSSFEQAGFASEDLGSGTLHSIEQEMLTLDDALVTLGETHYLGGDGWIATRWIQYIPEGYTQDIVASLWG